MINSWALLHATGSRWRHACLGSFGFALVQWEEDFIHVGGSNFLESQTKKQIPAGAGKNSHVRQAYSPSYSHHSIFGFKTLPQLEGENRVGDACKQRGHPETKPPTSWTRTLPVWSDKTQHSWYNFLAPSDKTRQTSPLRDSVNLKVPDWNVPFTTGSGFKWWWWWKI